MQLEFDKTTTSEIQSNFEFFSDLDTQEKVPTKKMQALQLDPPNTTTVPKNVALVAAFGNKELTLRKQKALHAIVLTVRESFFLRNPQITDSNIMHLTEKDVQNTNTTFEIAEGTVMAALGYKDKSKFYSYGQVLNLFEQIADDTLGFDGLGIVKSKAEREQWTGFTKVLASVERGDGYYSFNMPPKMVFRIVNPEISFQSPVSWSGYKTKYTPAIYESCLYYWQNNQSETEWFSLDYLRRITGTTSKTYDDYNKFRKRVLDKVLDNINHASELDLHLGFEADNLLNQSGPGRKKVTHIRFTIAEKVGRIADSDDVRNGIMLSSVKTEMESLGVPRNAINSLMADCQDEQGNLSLPYLKWCIKKGHELRKLKKYHPNNRLEDGATAHNFGGYWRKHIVYARKADWFSTYHVLCSMVTQTSPITSKLQMHDLEDQVVKAELKIKKQIAKMFIQDLSDTAFCHFKNSFVDFLEVQLPDLFARYEAGEYGHSLYDMAANGEYCLMVYLDYYSQIFTPEAFKYCISDKKLMLQ